MLDQLKAPLRLLRTVTQRDQFLLRFTHLLALLGVEPGTSTASPPPDDAALVRRVMAAYGAAQHNFASNGDSMWQGFFERMHSDIHAAAIGGNAEQLTRILRDPSQNDLFFGFDAVSKTDSREVMFSPGHLYGRKLILEGLARLAEAVGARRLFNPELPVRTGLEAQLQADSLLDVLDAFFGFRIELPNPFPNEGGVRSSRGIISWRVPQALYQAWLIAKLVSRNPAARVLEIGGGLGRTAFYARQFGIRDYTIVDIPITALAQGYFLGRTLGDDAVLLAGEATGDDQSRVKLISPADFHAGDGRYDLIVNIDSLTELDRSIAAAYIGELVRRTDCFLSINHEGNGFTVRELMTEAYPEIEISRAPYWLRQGYVDEVAFFDDRSRR